MVTFEALNALYGDCLLLRYLGPDGNERLRIIDGGPKSENVNGKPLAVWKDVLLPRLKEIYPTTTPLPVALGMVSHIDDDHINGIQKLRNELVAATPANPPPSARRRSRHRSGSIATCWQSRSPTSSPASPGRFSRAVAPISRGSSPMPRDTGSLRSTKGMASRDRSHTKHRNGD
jgi:hypothetical protein